MLENVIVIKCCPKIFISVFQKFYATKMSTFFYFEPIKFGESFELEYQVIDGGDLDITFQLIDPKGRLVSSDVRKEDGVHSVDNPISGDYQFCFDNSFSRVTEKVVFFEIYREEDYDYYDEDWNADLPKDSEALQDRMDEIQLALSRMKMNMVKTSQIQNLQKN